MIQSRKNLRTYGGKRSRAVMESTPEALNAIPPSSPLSSAPSTSDNDEPPTRAEDQVPESSKRRHTMMRPLPKEKKAKPVANTSSPRSRAPTARQKAKSPAAAVGFFDEAAKSMSQDRVAKIEAATARAEKKEQRLFAKRLSLASGTGSVTASPERTKRIPNRRISSPSLLAPGTITPRKSRAAEAMAASDDTFMDPSSDLSEPDEEPEDEPESIESLFDRLSEVTKPKPEPSESGSNSSTVVNGPGPFIGPNGACLVLDRHYYYYARVVNRDGNKFDVEDRLGKRHSGIRGHRLIFPLDERDMERLATCSIGQTEVEILSSDPPDAGNDEAAPFVNLDYPTQISHVQDHLRQVIDERYEPAQFRNDLFHGTPAQRRLLASKSERGDLSDANVEVIRAALVRLFSPTHAASTASATDPTTPAAGRPPSEAASVNGSNLPIQDGSNAAVPFGGNGVAEGERAATGESSPRARPENPTELVADQKAPNGTVDHVDAAVSNDASSHPTAEATSEATLAETGALNSSDKAVDTIATSSTIISPSSVSAAAEHTDIPSVPSEPAVDVPHSHSAAEDAPNRFSQLSEKDRLMYITDVLLPEAIIAICIKVYMIEGSEQEQYDAALVQLEQLRENDPKTLWGMICKETNDARRAARTKLGLDVPKPLSTRKTLSGRETKLVSYRE